MRHQSLRPERLANYNGPKLAKYLRREVEQQAASLYEKVTLLRLLDPEFEAELLDLGAIEFLDRYGELLLERRQESADQVRDATSIAQEGADNE